MHIAHTNPPGGGGFSVFSLPLFLAAVVKIAKTFQINIADSFAPSFPIASRTGIVRPGKRLVLGPDLHKEGQCLGDQQHYYIMPLTPAAMEPRHVFVSKQKALREARDSVHARGKKKEYEEYVLYISFSIRIWNYLKERSD